MKNRFLAITVTILIIANICFGIFSFKIYDKIHQMHQLSLSNIYERLARYFVVYTAYDENGPLEFLRLGREYDGGYVTPVKALKNSDVLLGYGIADDSSFEEEYSRIYNKHSYGFDCGVDHVGKHPLFTFVKECIASDKFLYGSGKKNSSSKITSFNHQIKSLNLEGKKVFIKMDIEGAEYDAFDEILEYHDNITGIVLEIHCWSTEYVKKSIRILNSLNRNFVLVHIHGNNFSETIEASNCIGMLPCVIELTYINKNLLTKYEISNNQKHPLPIDMPNYSRKLDAEFEIIPN